MPRYLLIILVAGKFTQMKPTNREAKVNFPPSYPHFLPHSLSVRGLKLDVKKKKKARKRILCLQKPLCLFHHIDLEIDKEPAAKELEQGGLRRGITGRRGEEGGSPARAVRTRAEGGEERVSVEAET